MRIWKEFAFEAAHRLPNVPKEHKCGRLHGHSYRFTLWLEGEPDETTGWVADFGGIIRAAGDLVIRQLDHQYLNDIKGLENPTAELLAVWIWKVVAATMLDAKLYAVEVQETATCGVRYGGE